MLNLVQTIRETHVDPGSVAIFWLGQAGFVFKTPGGTVIYVDPYLTEYVQRALPEYGLGFRRMMPVLVAPEEAEADFVFSTHSHQDHFDADAIPVLAQKPGTHFAGAPDCLELYHQAGVPEDRFTIFHKGQTLDFGDFRLTGVYADHGELAPDALGVLLTIGDIKIWQVGDTAYRPEQWQDMFDVGIDIVLPPINGAFGNLNGTEAAKLAHDAHARVAIPCHFWMFPLHYGNPMEFLEGCRQYAPEVQPVLMTQGECFVYHK